MRTSILLLLLALPAFAQQQYDCTSNIWSDIDVPAYKCSVPIVGSISITASASLTCGKDDHGHLIQTGGSYASSVTGNGACGSQTPLYPVPDCPPSFEALGGTGFGSLTGFVRATHMSNGGGLPFCFKTGTQDGNSVSCPGQTCTCSGNDYITMPGYCPTDGGAGGCTNLDDPCYGEDACCPGGTCSPNEGMNCDGCGTIDCGGACEGGCGGGGSGGDPCNGANCPNGCIEVYYQGRMEAECQDWTDPILIDLTGAGFQLTTLQKGVQFNFYGNGPSQMAWTAPKVANGWLVLDRHQNGTFIGQDLMSNITPQPGPAGTHTGFKALAMFDTKAFGGNSDGWIDKKDSVWPKLQVWMDLNHNGAPDPGELLTMDQAGIQRISVDAKLDANYVDAYGNQFRYRSKVLWTDSKKNGQDGWIYDVILQSAK